jgi:hypothetical protein
MGENETQILKIEKGKRKREIGNSKSERRARRALQTAGGRALLRRAGIEAMIAPDDAGGMEPGLWMGGVKLLARATDAARARKILKEKRGNGEGGRGRKKSKKKREAGPSL